LVVADTAFSDPIIVQMISSASATSRGLILVSVPTRLLFSGADFEFPLPRQIMSLSGANNPEEQVTLPDGSALPNWLQYNPEAKSFLVINIPEDELPLQIIVNRGGQSWIVRIAAEGQPGNLLVNN